MGNHTSITSERWLGEAIVTRAFVPNENGVALTSNDFVSFDIAIWLDSTKDEQVLLESQDIDDVVFDLLFDSPDFVTTGYNFLHTVEYGFEEFRPPGDSVVRIEYVLHRKAVTQPIVIVHFATLHNVRVVSMLAALNQ